MTKIKIICENTSFTPGVFAEHGFSVLIEKNNKKILFDTGNGMSLFHNSKVLGVSLSELDGIVLSHGHNDHTGGLLKLLRLNPKIRVFSHPDVLKQKYKVTTEKSSYIGINPKIPENYFDNFTFVRSPVQIFDTFWLSGEITRKYSQEKSTKYFLDKNGQHPDIMLDEEFLIIEEDDGIIAITGCCHFGLENIFHFLEKKFPQKKLKLLLGGLHLKHLDQKSLKHNISILISKNPLKLGVSHCTGPDVYTGIKFSFPLSSFWASAGMEFAVR